jgi:hypothetical protein
MVATLITVFLDEKFKRVRSIFVPLVLLIAAATIFVVYKDDRDSESLNRGLRTQVKELQGSWTDLQPRRT